MMPTLANMTLAVVTTTLNQRPTIRGQGRGLQGRAAPVVQGQGHLAVVHPVRDPGQGHETERSENILVLGQGNW